MEGRLNVFIDFARPPKPERRRVDLAAVVGETLALVGGRARKQRVTLKFTPPATPVVVEADGEQVRQLLVNLALNALDVMPRGGILEIELRPAERTSCRAGGARHRAGHRAAAPAPALRAVLHQQGDGARAGPGRLAADRSEPRRQPPGDEPAAGRGLLRPPPADGARAGLGIFSGTDMATILVIDDETSILHAFRRAFADPEDTLQTASDGSEGLELVARCRPDVVVLDLNLPDMSGLDVFHRIRAIDARIPVIFITGHGHDRDGHRGDEAGGLRLPAQAAGRRPRPGAGRARRGDQPADARARRGRRRGAGAGPGRRPRRPLAGDAGGLQGDRPGRAAGRHRADPGRERHGQGAGRPGHLPAQPAGRRAVPGDQLRRHPGEPAGERAVRPREGGVHRGRPPADRQVRAVRGRHAVPRRDRRHDAADAGEDAARAPGRSGSSASAATRRSGPTSG